VCCREKELGGKEDAKMENRLFNSINWQDTEDQPTLDDREEAVETEDASLDSQSEDPVIID
jgi:hypothetical protein